MPQVNPEILMWARKSAGLSIDAAAEKLNVAADRLENLENVQGEDFPSRRLLVRMSKVYRRPLLAFYLSSPPRTGDRGEDFRTLPEQQQARESSFLVDALIRNVKARQSMVRAALLDEGDAKPLQFVGSATMDAGVASLVAKIEAALQLSAAQFQAQPTAEAAFNLLRERTESIGVFVLLIGNLGSHHTAIDVNDFRGFALADDIAPFVVVNDQDAKQAWAFTLIHELAHLWLGASGVSGAYSESVIERFCNEVAAEFLLPRRQLSELKLAGVTDKVTLLEKVSAFAAGRNVSHTMVAYRLYVLGVIQWKSWQELRSFFREQWIANRERARSDARTQDGGPSYYVVRRHRVGSSLIDVVRRAMADGNLTPTKAGAVLGVKPLYVHGLLDLNGARS